MLNKREILSAGLASFVAASLPKTVFASQTILSSSAIQSDIALLKRVYTNLHPGLYRYSTPAQVDARFAALSQKFSQPASLSQVYLELSKLLASVRCGHSYANFYSQSEAVQNSLYAGKNRLPFKFAWLDREMVVTDPAGVVGLEKGSRITRINGIAARRILATLLPYVRADGHNIGKQTSLLSVNRDEGYQTFDIFYTLHFGSAENFELVGKLPTGAALSLRVPAIDLAARRAMTAPPALPNDAPRWQLQLRDDKTAIMTMPTFGLYRTSWDWKAWLATSFTAVKEASATKLIIDLRGNEGGRDDCGPEILSYLTDKPLPPQAGQRRLRYQKIPEDLNPILETWDDRFRNWGDKARLRPDGMYDFLDETGRSGGGVSPKAPHFTGKVVVLTDATNSSATLQFCQMLRANGLGKIVGGTTGGNLRGINAEKFMFCRLPGTGLEVDVPLVGFFPDGAPADSGLVPDIAVAPRWQDIAQGSDPVMDRALSAST
jgi:hypothetical protein